MKQKINSLSICVALIIAVFIAFPVFASVELPDDDNRMEGETIIIHTNDSHGRAVADASNGVLGFSTVSALKKAYESAGANVILLDAGDTLHGLPFATVTKGESVVSLMNLAGYDAMTPGNHDFNYGTDYLLQLSNKMNFSLLSANATAKSTGEKLFSSNTIIEKNGIKYGIFGLTTPETAYKTNPSNVADVQFLNPVDAARQQVKALKDKNADYIVAVAHVGLSGDSEVTTEMIAHQVDGIDVIIDGHSHTLLPDGIKVKDTLIASAGEYLEHIGVVQIRSDGTKQSGIITINEFSRRDFAIDAEAEKVTEEQEQILSEVVGSTSVFLDGQREHVRRQETNLGNLAADAVRAETGADVAMINGGGIRASVPAGQVTKGDLVSVFPFGNYVVTKKISGSTLKACLEQGVKAYPEMSGGFPQVSGISFEFDGGKPAGSRIGTVIVGETPLDEGETYVFATNDYIAAGGDQYTMIQDALLVHEFSSLEECLIRYIKDKGMVEAQIEERIVNTANTAAASQKSQEMADHENTKEPDKKTEEIFVYTVRQGDTLWKIAKNQFGHGEQWNVIYQMNQDKIKSPDRIQAGMELRIK